ncbi:MAG: GGDEF domain-containing protein [Pannonibacter phragmitetus]
MADAEDFKRTITYGEAALSYIRRNVIPAHPRNYETWYTYAAGFNQALNRAINDLIATKGSISADDLQRIYSRFLSPNRLGDRVDEVGTRVAEEVQDLVDAIRISTDATSDFGRALDGVLARLHETLSDEKLRDLTSAMVKATHAAIAANRNLESQLLESNRQIRTLKENLEAIRYESLTDELTTLSNRRHFDLAIDRAIELAARTGEGFALLLTDIDHFKSFNDRFGHQTGDLAVKQSIKGQDIACRYGGEEFAIILPEAQILDAMEVAEQIRKAVMGKELVKRSTGENLGRLTLSIGVSLYEGGDTSQMIIGRADAALYAAKHSGRNAVRSLQSDEMAANQTGSRVA